MLTKLCLLELEKKFISEALCIIYFHFWFLHQTVYHTSMIEGGAHKLRYCQHVADKLPSLLIFKQNTCNT